MATYSVLIAGAGPTGLVLANLLGQYGIRTLLVEANASTVGEPRAVSIDDESIRVVQAMGLLQAIGQDIVFGYGSEYRSPSGRTFLRVKPLTEPYGHPRRNAFRQTTFEAKLREGLSRYPHIETRFQCAVDGFEQTADGVIVGLRPNDGPPIRVSADYLLGCDGARSFIREELGLTLVGSTLDERWLIIDLEGSPASSRETIVFCNAARPGIALPGPDQTRRYEFKLLAGEDEAQMLSAARIADLLASHDAAPGSTIVRKTVYHFHAKLANQWGRGRVWLAGDAAHLMPPFAGQGMNSGIRDAYNLAWKVAHIARGLIGPDLILSYEGERRGHVLGMMRLALRMGAIMGPRTRGHAWATRLLFRTLGLWPAIRSYFAEMKYKPPPRFDGGFILESMLSRSGIVGRMLPQPRLRSGPQAGRKLDELLGDGFTLLGVGVEPERVSALSLGAHWDRMIDVRLALSIDDAPELAPHAGKLLLLRPDRYVMARFEITKSEAVLAMLDELWRQSWLGSEERPIAEGKEANDS